MKNIELSKALISQLASQGVREFIVCGGARNSPLVLTLANANGLNIYSFFEERSAAFFALGRARATRSPVAVVTTSGTAVAQLLPALIEAFYSGVQLIAITADRPRRLRHTGAPQTINQENIFGSYVENFVELEGKLDPITIPAGSMHINVCFDEPLLDLEVTSWHAPAIRPSMAQQSQAAEFAAVDSALKKFLEQHDQPLVLVSGLDNSREIEAVENFLARLQAPVYAEGSSGLRESTRFFNIRGGDAALENAWRNGEFDSVIRIGSVPTARIWRDLEKNSKFPILHLSQRNFKGLSHGLLVHTDLSALTEVAVDSVKLNEFWAQQNLKAIAELNELFIRLPCAEPSWFLHFTKCIGTEELCYTGNSLPIREWDLAALTNISHHALANRGANGIDGQLSTFFAMACSNAGAWGFFGDLTAMYDLSGPWALRYTHGPTRTVIINNGGGKIFERIFKNPLFENSHDVSFRGWAEMWKLKYQAVRTLADLPSTSDIAASQEHWVFEVLPDPEQTKCFWQEWESFWKNQM